MTHISIGRWMALLILIILAAGIRGQTPNFALGMEVFEVAKRNGDHRAGETALLEALQHGSSEYALGSLVWTQMKQNKTEQALATAIRMVDAVGTTPYAVGSLLEAAIREGDRSKTREAAALGRRVAPTRDPGDWKHKVLENALNWFDTLERGARYELEWTIPQEDLRSGNRLFGFPILNSPTQTFEFELEGAASHRIVESDEKRTVVEIRGSMKRDVVVRGKATIRAETLGRQQLRKIQDVPLKRASREKTGIFYYWEEPFDPSSSSIAPIARDLARASAVRTLQAILDWRDSEMPYGKLQPGPGTTLDRIAKQRTGVCHDASYMTASLARANGIPAVVMGVYVLPTSGVFNNVEGSHGHIRALVPDLGWVAMEPLRKDSLQYFDGSNYLQFAVQEEKDKIVRSSLQGYPVSGRRVE